MRDLDYKSTTNFQNGDIFGMSFDFKNDSLQLYHNNNKADKISLYGDKTAIPALSLTNKHDEIEILKLEIR